MELVLGIITRSSKWVRGTAQSRSCSAVTPQPPCAPQNPDRRSGRSCSFCGVDLVKDAAVPEVLPLRFRPAAKILIDGDEFEFREAREILRISRLRLDRAIEVLSRDLL